MERLPKLEPGRGRAFIQCTHPGCKAVYWYDYQPFGLSSPVITKPCGHGITERLYATSKSITKKEFLATAKRSEKVQMPPPHADVLQWTKNPPSVKALRPAGGQGDIQMSELEIQQVIAETGSGSV